MAIPRVFPEAPAELDATATYRHPRRRPHLKLVGSSVRPKLWEQIPIDVMSGGVTLHLDAHEEALYIDCEPGYSQTTLVILLGALPSYGVEVMPEDECPSETLDDGTVRVWLAEVVE